MLEALWRVAGSVPVSDTVGAAHAASWDAPWILVFFHCVTKMFMTKMQITAARLANVHDALKENVLCEFLAPIYTPSFPPQVRTPAILHLSL